MKQIIIPFTAWSVSKILKGEKTATSRNKRYGDVGDYFYLHDTIFTVSKLESKTLDDVATNHYREEGCISQDEFIELWCKIHPIKGFVPDQKVWYHEFVRGSRK